MGTTPADGASVVVVRTGVANLASMLVALERAGATARVSQDASEIADAERVVLPGVGAFGAGMRALRECGLDRALAARVRAGMPTLCVCLGMQLLFEESEETPGERGLGVVSGKVTRFGPGVRVPQMGWNVVEVAGDSLTRPEALLERGAAFFANSYRVAAAPEGWRCATSEHGEGFVAAMERGSVLACQFHPELSGAYGAALIARWIASAGCVESRARRGEASC